MLFCVGFIRIMNWIEKAISSIGFYDWDYRDIDKVTSGMM